MNIKNITTKELKHRLCMMIRYNRFGGFSNEIRSIQKELKTRNQP